MGVLEHVLEHSQISLGKQDKVFFCNKIFPCHLVNFSKSNFGSNVIWYQLNNESTERMQTSILQHFF